jgi:putative methylase
MGRFISKRMVRKRDLEFLLSNIAENPFPKAFLEQYTTSSKVAADTLHLAAYIYDDIIEKTVMELGCGTARLAIGAVLLGAKQAFGVDLDKNAIKIANKNAKMLDVSKKTNWLVSDIENIRGSYDTILQNPPFGVQRKRADRKFITKSLNLGRVIYSFHKRGDSNRKFIKRFIEGQKGKISNIFPMTMEIPRMFKFHTKKKRVVQVDLYRIEGKNQ